MLLPDQTRMPSFRRLPLRLINPAMEPKRSSQACSSLCQVRRSALCCANTIASLLLLHVFTYTHTYTNALLTALPSRSRPRVPVATADIHLGALRRVRPRAINQPLLDVGSERVKGLVDVDVALCADLEEGDAEFVCKGLATFCTDDTFLFPIALVANENLVDALGGVLLDVGEPCADVCRITR